MVIGMTKTQAASAKWLCVILAEQMKKGLSTVNWGDAHSLVSRLQWKSMVLMRGASELSYLWKLINFQLTTSPHAAEKALEELNWLNLRFHRIISTMGTTDEVQEMAEIERLYEKTIVLCFLLIEVTSAQYFFLVHDVMPFSYGPSKGRGRGISLLLKG